MSYTRLNLETGDTVEASHVSHIENGIVSNESDIAELNQSLTDIDVLGNTGTVITDGSDLDDYVTPGRYYYLTNSSIEHIPVTSSSNLFVLFGRSESIIFQFLIPNLYNIVIYARYFTNNAWYDWRQITTSAVSTTSTTAENSVDSV